MNKSELESKHLSELHTLAADAGVEGYRMLPRAELIEKLADGSSGGGSGSSGGGRGERSRGGERGGRGGGGGGRGGERGGRGGDRGRGGERGNREPRQRRERQPRSDQQQRPKPEGEKPAPRERTPAPEPRSDEGGERPKRRRRRRRFGRRGGKTVRAHEMLLPGASGRQALVYAESREACTALLRELAAELAGDKGPDPVALLVDPSPEELAEWKREAPKAEIVSAGQERHAEDALAQAARRAESGEPVVLLIDSLTRVAEQFGGAKAAKELFDGGLGAGGAGAGSLTIVAAVERSD